MNTVSQGSSNPVELRQTTDAARNEAYYVRVLIDTNPASGDGFVYLYLGPDKCVAEEFAHNAEMVMHA